MPAGGPGFNERVRFAIGDVCDEANLFDNGSTSYKWGTMQCRGIGMGRCTPADRPSAFQRADDIAATGWSPIAATAITISAQAVTGHDRRGPFPGPRQRLSKALARLVRSVGGAAAGSSGQGWFG